MFSLPYLYYYLIASFFSFMLRRYAVRSESNTKRGVDSIIATYSHQDNFVENNRGFLKVIGSLCAIASIVFLILGFWYMPKWWYPLVFFGISFLASTFLPISDEVGGTIGMLLSPIACVLMYLSLFGIIA